MSDQYDAVKNGVGCYEVAIAELRRRFLEAARKKGEPAK